MLEVWDVGTAGREEGRELLDMRNLADVNGMGEPGD